MFLHRCGKPDLKRSTWKNYCVSSSAWVLQFHENTGTKSCLHLRWSLYVRAFSAFLFIHCSWTAAKKYKKIIPFQLEIKFLNWSSLFWTNSSNSCLHLLLKGQFFPWVFPNPSKISDKPSLTNFDFLQAKKNCQSSVDLSPIHVLPELACGEGGKANWLLLIKMHFSAGKDEYKFIQRSCHRHGKLSV